MNTQTNTFAFRFFLFLAIFSILAGGLFLLTDNLAEALTINCEDEPEHPDCQPPSGGGGGDPALTARFTPENVTTLTVNPGDPFNVTATDTYQTAPDTTCPQYFNSPVFFIGGNWTVPASSYSSYLSNSVSWTGSLHTRQDWNGDGFVDTNDGVRSFNDSGSLLYPVVTGRTSFVSTATGARPASGYNAPVGQDGWSSASSWGITAPTTPGTYTITVQSGTHVVEGYTLDCNTGVVPSVHTQLVDDTTFLTLIVEAPLEPTANLRARKAGDSTFISIDPKPLYISNNNIDFETQCTNSGFARLDIPGKTTVLVNSNSVTVTSSNVLTDGTAQLTCRVDVDAVATEAIATIPYTIINTAPTVTLNGSSSLTLCVGDTYNESGATAFDTEEGTLTPVAISGSVNTAIANTYILTYSITDFGGLSDNETRTVVVESCGGNTPPEVTPLGDNPMNVPMLSLFTDPGATADDLEDGDLTLSIVVSGSVNMSVPGPYTLTYSVEDSGNPSGIKLSDAKPRTVNVTNTPPEVDPIGANPMNLFVGDTYNELGATVTDAEESGLPYTISGTVNTSIADTYFKTYSATDSGGLPGSADRQVNVNACTASVTVWSSETTTYAINPGVTSDDDIAENSSETFPFVNVSSSGTTLTLTGAPVDGNDPVINNNNGSGSMSTLVCGDNVTFTMSYPGAPPPIPPTVSLTAPTNGQTFTAPASIWMSATANDADGTVIKVDFYASGILVGTDDIGSSPFTSTWNSVSAGSYAMTAVATDDDGLTTITSESVNITVNDPDPENVLPSCSFTKPSTSTYTDPATFDIEVSATDSDGTITQVVLSSNGSPLPPDTTSPYSWPQSGVPAGTYVLTAVATDNDGGTANCSAALTVTVNPPAPGVLSATLVSDKSSVGPGETFTLTYTSTNAGACWSSDDLPGQDNTWKDFLAPNVNPPYYDVSGDDIIIGPITSSQSYKMTCIEEGGFMEEDASVTVNFGPTLSMSFTSPADQEIFTSGETIPQVVTTTDPSDLIKEVEFWVEDYDNGGPLYLGSDTGSSPYTDNWTEGRSGEDVIPGSYVLQAIGKDINGITIGTADIDVIVIAVAQAMLRVVSNKDITSPGGYLILPGVVTTNNPITSSITESHTVTADTQYTVTGTIVDGDSPVITNSDGGGAVATPSAGDNILFTLTYPGSPPPPPESPPVISFTSLNPPSPIDYDTKTTVSFTATNADTCDATSGPWSGSWSDSGDGDVTYIRSAGSTGASASLNIGTSGTNRLVVVMADDESDNTNLTGVTVDGKSCNLVTRANNTVGAGNHSEMWYCDESDLGASSGTVSVAIQGGDGSWATHAHLYTGVGQSGPYDNQIDQISGNEAEVDPAVIDIPANGLLVMGAGHGDSDTWNNTDWDTNPTEVADDGLSPEIEMTEATDGPRPNSAAFGTAYWISSTGAQVNRQLRARSNDVAFRRGTGIVASWDRAGSTISESQLSQNLTASSVFELMCDGPGGQSSNSVPVIVSSEPEPNFDLNTIGDLTLDSFSGTSTPITILISDQDSFSSVVTLDIKSSDANLSGAIIFFSDSELSSPEYETGSQFTIGIPNSLSSGSYPIIIRGIGGGLTRTTQVFLNVQHDDTRIIEEF